MAQANWEQELKEAKRDVSEASNEEIRLQTRHEEAKRRKSDAIAKVKAMGIDPKDLKATLDKKRDELEATLEEIRESLPGDDGDGE